MNAKKSVTEFKAANKVGVYFPDDSVVWKTGLVHFSASDIPERRTIKRLS